MLPALTVIYSHDGPRQMRTVARYFLGSPVEFDISLRASLNDKFTKLTTQWQDETWFMSNADNIAKHPAYQEIIQMGKPALPLILDAMRTAPNHWFWALNLITNADAVKAEHAGNIQAMTQDWLDWGKKHCII